jgi:hypothetical protein
VNAILPPGLTTDVRPITLASLLERLPGFGKQMIASTPLEAGDVLIVHSVSGRNTVVVEAAQAVRESGVFMVALTSWNIHVRAAAPAKHAPPVRSCRSGDGRSRPGWGCVDRTAGDDSEDWTVVDGVWSNDLE